MTPHVPPTGGPDRDAIERFRQRDPRAFEQVFDSTSPAAYALARRICGNPAAAEGAMQNAYLDVWRRAGTYDPELASVTTWVMCVVRNRSIDAVRRVAVHERRRAERDEWLLDSVAADRHVCELVIEGDRARTVHAAVATLPRKQRRVIELSFAGGLSQSETAEQMRLPLGTVMSRVRLGLRQLRLRVDDDLRLDEHERPHPRSAGSGGGQPDAEPTAQAAAAASSWVAR